MKRIFIAVLIVTAFGVPGFAQEKASALPGMGQALSEALQDMSAAQLGTLTVADLETLAGRISVAVQKVRYVEKARRASMIFPGAGQFMTGDATGGTLYLVGDLALLTGTLAGAYFLLPANVRFGDLDYFDDSIGTIKASWESNSIMDYLPSFGVMAGGMILKGILGHFSAANAAEEARRNIADGKVTFVPDFGFMGHGFGMEMRMMF
jgi:hypothetical protein